MSSFLFITLATFVDVLFPGPNFIITSSIARKFGKNHALKMLFGILTACAFWCIFLFLGSLILFIKYPFLKLFIKIIGGIYIFRLAIKMIAVNLKKRKENEKEIKTPNNNYFLNGFINCILNPEVGLFYMIMFTRIIDEYGHNNFILFLYSLEFIFIQFICFYLIIEFFSRSGKILGKYIKFIDISLSVILIILLLKLSKNILIESSSYLNNFLKI